VNREDELPKQLKTKDIKMLYRFVVLGLMKERLDAKDGIKSDMDVALGATDQSQHHEPLAKPECFQFKAGINAVAPSAIIPTANDIIIIPIIRVTT
jgi:hypothetical protein